MMIIITIIIRHARGCRTVEDVRLRAPEPGVRKTLPRYQGESGLINYCCLTMSFFTTAVENIIHLLLTYHHITYLFINN